MLASNQQVSNALDNLFNQEHGLYGRLEDMPLVWILVARRNRAPLLRRLLESLTVAQARAGLSSEVIVIDNGSTDETAEILHSWSRVARNRVVLREERRGRSRALNRGLAGVRGTIVAFTDDDVVVGESWLHAMVEFFARNPQYQAAVGPISLPDSIMADTELITRLQAWRTFPLLLLGNEICEAPDLIGANNCVLRPALEAVGLFDERLGVGASGFGEDTEFGCRLVKMGFRIGYAPEMRVVHHYDPKRATPSYYRDAAVRHARTEFVMVPDGRFERSLLRAGQYALLCMWTLVAGSADDHLKRSVRLAVHVERLKLRWRYRWTGGLP